MKHTVCLMLILISSANAMQKGALSRAIRKGDKEALQKFFEENGDVDLDLGNFWTLLHKAVFWNHCIVASFLLKAGAQVDSVVSGETVLHRAAFWGHDHIARLLMQYNAPMNAQESKGQTALHLGAFHGYIPVVKILLHSGALAEICDDNKEKPSDIAHGRGHSTLAQLLIDHVEKENEREQEKK